MEELVSLPAHADDERGASGELRSAPGGLIPRQIILLPRREQRAWLENTCSEILFVSEARQRAGTCLLHTEES